MPKPKSNNLRTVFSNRLPEDLLLEIDELCIDQNSSRTELVEKAVREYLEKLNDRVNNG